MAEQAFEPLYSGQKIVPSRPSENTSPRIAELWSYYIQVGWNDRIHSRLTFDFLINAAEFSRGRPLLDAGAGHQAYKPFFKDCIYLSQEHPQGIAFKQMEALQYDFISPIDKLIPVKDGSLACTLNTSVLEHVRYPEAFLREAFRVLCPGGRLYIHAPFCYCEHEQPYDFQRPSRYGLAAWLKSAGFAKVNVLPSSNSCYGSSWFFVQAMEYELSARGALEALRSLRPILKHCVDTINDETDDYIDRDVTMPVGWIAIAEKDGDVAGYVVASNDKCSLLREIALA